MSYNGWKNYETWNVALWIDNEEPTYRERCLMVETAIKEAPFDENVASSIWTVEQAERYRLADILKAWVRDELVPDLGASMAADLLGAALDEVDWQEIAENWLGDADRKEA